MSEWRIIQVGLGLFEVIRGHVQPYTTGALNTTVEKVVALRSVG